MKKIIVIIIVFLTSGICSFSQVRPPIVTNSLQTANFKWRGLDMKRDSLPYWLPVSEHSFILLRPDGTFSQTYTFNSDSISQLDTLIVEWTGQKVGNKDTIRTPLAYTYAINEEGDTITLIEGGTFTRNDSTFQVRKDPFCSYCWQYKYSSETVWKELYCESVSTGRILIDDNAEKILGMTYDLNIGNWRDRLFFQTDTAAKKDLIIMQRGDSVDWQPVPKDSIFYKDKWVHGGDSLNIDSDSIFYEDSWLKNGDSIRIVLPRTDSLFWYAGSWMGRKDTLIINNRIDTIYSQITRTDTVFSQIVRTDTIYSQVIHADTIYLGTQYLGVFDSIKINDVWLENKEAVQIDSSKWSYDSWGVHLKSPGNVGIGYSATSQNRLYVGTSSNNVIGIRSEVAGNGYAVDGTSTEGIAGYFDGKTGVWTNNAVIRDSLRVGSGSTITRTGTMAEMDFWSGTKAEYDAISHDQNTLYYLSENFNIFQIIFLLLISLGSKAQNWSAVKVGSTDIDSIMKGDVKIWEKPIEVSCGDITGSCTKFTFIGGYLFSNCEGVNQVVDLNSAKLLIDRRRSGCVISAQSLYGFNLDLISIQNIYVGCQLWYCPQVGDCSKYPDTYNKWFVAYYSSVIGSSIIVRITSGKVSEVYYY